jgi:hypothetical protein
MRSSLDLLVATAVVRSTMIPIPSGLGHSATAYTCEASNPCHGASAVPADTQPRALQEPSAPAHLFDPA